MNAGELTALGRRLIELARSRLVDPDDPALSPAESAVLSDVLRNPGTTAGQIAGRVGFAQSRVSTALAALRQLGVVRTEPSPADRRASLVHVVDEATEEIRRRVGRSIDADLTAVLAKQGAEGADTLLAALETLHRALCGPGRTELPDQPTEPCAVAPD